ncbi:MAG: right-handed parallel beta-helix repeat-containing protein [Desulfurellales bacterium]|nr:MAG: right-handed parallel beta-helix repeat-containing protein [Desulfurellales bacterium]
MKWQGATLTGLAVIMAAFAARNWQNTSPLPPKTAFLDNYVSKGQVESARLLAELPDGGVIQCSPATVYLFKTPLRFTKSVTILGFSTTANRSTVWKFPIDSAGVSFTRTDTASSTGNIVSGIWFDGGHRDGAKAAHGCYATGRTDLADCVFEGFAGHGVFLDGTGVKGANGNVNRNTVTNCRFSRNGGDGLHVDGNDANVITVTGCDATNNEGNGFYDGAMMCNLYISPHTNGNGWRGGKVTHRCIRWFALSDSVPPGIEPGISQNWQAHWDTLFVARDGRCLPATVEFQAWQPGRAYKTARPFLFVGNARHTVINPYREDNQAAALFSGGTLVINGACRMDAKSKGQWLFQSTNGTTNATKQIKQ